MSNKKTGSKYALLLGIPFGLSFCGIILIASLFPPFNLFIFLSEAKIFWHPASWVIIFLYFIFLLYIKSKNIDRDLERKSSIATSFRFIFSINVNLFFLLLLIYTAGKFIYGISLTLHATLIPTLLFPVVLLFSFCFATFVTSLTLGLLIVKLTKNKKYLKT